VDPRGVPVGEAAEGKADMEVRRRHHITDVTVGRALKKAVRAARLSKKVTAHTLRHSYATHLLLSGVDLRSIQEALGHEDIRTTKIYAKVMRGILRVLWMICDSVSQFGGIPLDC
jgi:site-specific recombinase XerD